MRITLRCPLRRRLLICAMSLVLRLAWPTSLADADLDRVPERTQPATQEPVWLECDTLGVAESVTARMLSALGRPVVCVPRPLGVPRGARPTAQ
jgi:hypothetical protein